jgi:beta-lactamase regulating signal transducer with metallopeptidase domain
MPEIAIALMEIALEASALMAVALVGVRLTRQYSRSVQFMILAAATVGVFVVSFTTSVETGRYSLQIPVEGRVEAIRATSEPDTPDESLEYGVTATRDAGQAEAQIVSSAGATPRGAAPPDAVSDEPVNNGLPFLFVALLSLWGAGALFQGLWLVMSYLRLLVLRRSNVTASGAIPVDGEIAALFRRRHVRVYRNPSVSVPMSYGVWRPTIVLPASTEIADADLVQILLHEAAHIRRHDFVWSIAVRILAVVHWFNPLYWWFRNELLVLQEAACDQKVIEATGDRLSYCEVLARFARSAIPRQTPVAHSIAGTRHQMKRRIQSMAAGARRGGAQWIAPVAVAAIVAFTALLTLTGCVTRQSEQPAYGAGLVIDAVWHEAEPIDPGQPEFAQIVEWQRHSAHYCAEIDILDGETIAIRLPGARLGPEAVTVRLNAAERYYTARIAIHFIEYAPARAREPWGLYDDVSNIGMRADEDDFLVSLGPVERTGSRLSTTLRFYGSENVETGQEFDAFREALTQYYEYRSMESIDDRLRYDHWLISWAIMDEASAREEYSDYTRLDLDSLMLPDPYRADGGSYSVEAGADWYVVWSVGPDGIDRTADDRVEYSVLYDDFSYGGDATREQVWDEEHNTWVFLLATGH